MMRRALVVLWVLLCAVTSANAQVGVSFNFNVPGVNIGVSVPAYPQLVPVPGYPVYYAPRLSQNYFFYDGMYWVFDGTNWYASSWYNGPWALVAPEAVPLYVLRVPVRYYRRPPAYFHGWAASAPPHWGEHWGHDWDRRHAGWDHWNTSAAPPPAPLPHYQRNYQGNRYPPPDQQAAVHDRNYHYRAQQPAPSSQQWSQEYDRKRQAAAENPGVQQRMPDGTLIPPQPTYSSPQEKNPGAAGH